MDSRAELAVVQPVQGRRPAGHRVAGETRGLGAKGWCGRDGEDSLVRNIRSIIVRCRRPVPQHGAGCGRGDVRQCAHGGVGHCAGAEQCPCHGAEPACDRDAEGVPATTTSPGSCQRSHVVWPTRTGVQRAGSCEGVRRLWAATPKPKPKRRQCNVRCKTCQTGPLSLTV